MTEPAGAPEVIVAVTADPSFDELMRRRPQNLTRADRDVLVRRARERRAAWEAKQQAKRDKAAGLEPTEEATPSEGDE